MIKKILLFGVTIVIAFSIFITVLCINNVVALDGNKLLVTLEHNQDKIDEINNEQKKKMQMEKETFANGTDVNNENNKTNTNYDNSTGKKDSSLAELLKEAEYADKEGQLLCETFGQGIKIVNKYSNTKYSDTVTDLRTIDRNTLEAMVSVAEQYKLTDEEISVIKTCLAEKYYVVRKSDPLRARINAILGIN